MVAPARKRIVKIQDILTWVEAFTIYSIVLCASQPARWADISHYKLLIIQTAKKFPGKAWQLYDTAFRKNAAASGLKDWSKMNPDLFGTFTVGRSLLSASSPGHCFAHQSGRVGVGAAWPSGPGQGGLCYFWSSQRFSSGVSTLHLSHSNLPQVTCPLPCFNLRLLTRTCRLNCIKGE